MSTVLPTRPKLPPAALLTGRPSTRHLLRWGAVVLVLHLFFLLSLSGTLDWQLNPAPTLRTGPVQIRALAAAAPTASDLKATPAARTRVALVEKPKPAPIRQPNATQPAAAPKTAPADNSSQAASSPTQEQALEPEPVSAAKLANPDPMPAQDQSTPSDTPTPTPAPMNVIAEGTEPGQNPNKTIASNEVTAELAAPERIASASLALPDLALASLPPSALLSYRLNGREKGIHYQASGELRWQHNANAYALNLSVKAFLLGSRQWRSVGQITATGLAPTRFSDSWRSERAAHFDRPNQRIVFSNNAPTAPLQPGAQDQVSLYPQLAAAMAQSGNRMQPGTRLQIQTATVRDALPWLLTLEKLETLQVDGKSVQAVKWVCQPRNRFDAQVEFWVSASHNWLPARIRITQISGNYIDLQLTGLEALTDLPPVQ